MEVRKTKKVVKEVEELVEAYTTCDRCGKKIELVNFEIFEPAFEVRSGEAYPEGGGYSTTKEADLCQGCTEFAINLLEENGVKFQSKEIDW